MQLGSWKVAERYCNSLAVVAINGKPKNADNKGNQRGLKTQLRSVTAKKGASKMAAALTLKPGQYWKQTKWPPPLERSQADKEDSQNGCRCPPKPLDEVKVKPKWLSLLNAALSLTEVVKGV